MSAGVHRLYILLVDFDAGAPVDDRALEGVDLPSAVSARAAGPLVIMETRSSGAALALLDVFRPDAVVLTADPSDGSAEALVQQIRRRADLRVVPVLALGAGAPRVPGLDARLGAPLVPEDAERVVRDLRASIRQRSSA